MLEKIEISGFCGFSEAVVVDIALADREKEGSGLTIITGANNSGKSSIIEVSRCKSSNESPNFSVGKRNQKHYFIS